MLHRQLGCGGLQSRTRCSTSRAAASTSSSVRPWKMIAGHSSGTVVRRSMAVQTDAASTAASEAAADPAAVVAAAADGLATAAAAANARSGAAARPGAAPRVAPSGHQQQQQQQQQQQSLTSAMIARATNKSLEEISMAAKSPSRVAYQGVPGAYSEMAARKACPDCEPLPCDQFEVAFQALSQWMAEWAVLPIENSLGGSIHAVYDLLLRYRLHIVGETSVAVNHCLLALPGTKLEDVTRVLSHPQALAQVDGYLRRLKVVKEAVDDTAGAAQMVAQQRLQGVAAVASRRAAELYGLEILDESIQDFRDNVTRFIKLSRDPLVTGDGDAGRAFKTSIVFSLKQGPGQLFKALSVFALRDIDMTKIESRPMRSNPILTLEAPAATPGGTPGDATPGGGQQRFNYLFYVDFVGSLAEPRCQNALRHLQESAPFLRVLGSYPMDLELGAVDSDRPVGFDGAGTGQA